MKDLLSARMYLVKMAIPGLLDAGETFFRLTRTPLKTCKKKKDYSTGG